MKLDTGSVLNITAAQLMGAIAPQLPPGYAQSSASLTGFLLTFCAQDHDSAADTRAAENADMRALFADLAAGVREAALRDRLLAASQTRDASLRISALDAANAELRQLLIALHEAVDGVPAAEAKIWTVLRSLAARRVVMLPGQ
ncbi:MAG TPA: hypothetical protein VMH86_01665 [Rhizomicrobium sp.]|nr:hypothetical protein [Rhizomicrobium sp.]